MEENVFGMSESAINATDAHHFTHTAEKVSKLEYRYILLGRVGDSSATKTTCRQNTLSRLCLQKQTKTDVNFTPMSFMFGPECVLALTELCQRRELVQRQFGFSFRCGINQICFFFSSSASTAPCFAGHYRILLG